MTLMLLVCGLKKIEENEEVVSEQFHLFQRLLLHWFDQELLATDDVARLLFGFHLLGDCGFDAFHFGSGCMCSAAFAVEATAFEPPDLARDLVYSGIDRGEDVAGRLLSAQNLPISPDRDLRREAVVGGAGHVLVQTGAYFANLRQIAFETANLLGDILTHVIRHLDVAAIDHYFHGLAPFYDSFWLAREGD
jgi:hypothetical protein